MYLDVILVVSHVKVLAMRAIRYENALLLPLPSLTVIRLVGLKQLAQFFSAAFHLNKNIKIKLYRMVKNDCKLLLGWEPVSYEQPVFQDEGKIV